MTPGYQRSKEQAQEVVRLAEFIRPIYAELDVTVPISDERLDDLHLRLLNLCRQMDAILHPEVYAGV